MNIEQVREYCLALPGVTEDSPYGPDMIVFRIERKIRSEERRVGKEC